MTAGEIIFEVREDETAGGYLARALGYSIFTGGKDLDKLRQNVKDATACHFEDLEDAPGSYNFILCVTKFSRDEAAARPSSGVP